MIESALDLADQLELFRESHPIRKVLSTGLQWEYLVGGVGAQAVILLPGGGGRAEDMFTLMGALEDDFKVIAISCPDDLSHVPDLAQAIAQIMDDQGVRGACLLGHSLGGMFAECFMLAYPERTDGLILANMAHYGTFRETLVRGALSVASLFPRDWLNRQATGVFSRLLKDSPDEEFWVPFLSDEFAGLSAIALANRVELMLDVIGRYPTKRLDLDAWKRGVLILESDNETGFTLAEREALRLLYPYAVTHVFQGAGHLSLYTQPEEFAAAVREFLCQYR